ncbi:MAG: AarF/UbiB family protein [Nitrososphaerota archaeon]
MPSTCLTIINDLNEIIDKINFELVDRMTNPNMQYGWICIKPNVTYKHYFEDLKKGWEDIIIQFVQQSKDCKSLAPLVELFEIINSTKMDNIKRTLESSERTTIKDVINQIDIDQLFLDNLANYIMKSEKEPIFRVTTDAFETFYKLGRVLGENCYCLIIELFLMVIKKYEKKYWKKFENKSKDQVVEMLREDYHKFKNFFRDINLGKVEKYRSDLVDDLVANFTGMFGLSIKSELEKLVPEDLGSLKEFFIKVISTYYKNLHPIVWAQVFKSITDNLFRELPLTPEEIFGFLSKHLLLNSGPFILKILQMIRPALTPEIARKYNLVHLKYPLMKVGEVNLILGRSVNNWDMYEIVRHFSASVGHVCLVRRVDRPDNLFVIKIIKPLAVAQTCWEYKTLYNVYDRDTCEGQFISRMLESNGRELNVVNEIENIKKGHQYYTGKYSELFGINIDANLTTIQYIENVVEKGTWYAFAMSLAPGVPLSKLVENDLLAKDTKYRANLHRCLDLLVYKFFFNIINYGFYHGDLHAGNIFFSYERKTVTLIDFGAVGNINLLKEESGKLIEIIIMSFFYNYDGLFDVMTDLLNSKCSESKIDKDSKYYVEFRKILEAIHKKNVENEIVDKIRMGEYENFIFGEERISNEKSEIMQEIPLPFNPDSVYSYLRYEPKPEEVVVENRDELCTPVKIMERSDSVSFTSILQMIIKFYASSGINIAIKFGEIYELQRAYILFLGVLAKVNYNEYRFNIVLRRAILNWKNITKLFNSKLVDVIRLYNEENRKYNELKEKISQKSKSTTSVISSVGGAANDHRYKYLKYKSKYLLLKNN